MNLGLPTTRGILTTQISQQCAPFTRNSSRVFTAFSWPKFETKPYEIIARVPIKTKRIFSTYSIAFQWDPYIFIKS